MKGDTDLTKCCQMHKSDLEGTASFANLQLQEDTYWVYKIQTLEGLFNLNVAPLSHIPESLFYHRALSGVAQFWRN